GSSGGLFLVWRRRTGFGLGRLLLALSLLYQAGCDRPSSGVAPKRADSSDAARKTEIVPLTNMVLIKAGSFIRVKQPITLSRDFWLGKYEITQGEFESVMGKNPSHFK